MKLNFTYDLSAARVLNDPAVYGRLKKMRSAGVDMLYLCAYFYGRLESKIDEIVKAKALLENEGFKVGILNVPCGHGGNALNPDDPTVDLTIGEGWSMRCDGNGNPMPTTTCIDEKMISDSKKINDELYSLGFRKFINDDDLRLGAWGANMQGCFCDRCMSEFSAKIGRTVSRQEITAQTDPDITEEWMTYQCAKVEKFLKETTPAGAENGIMVMHNGDRRHGIDIKKLRRAMPDNLVFRVGEGHFCNEAFEHPDAVKSLENSIITHIARVGDPDICFSESTVFPANALSPENWIEKMKIEIRCGLRNLYLMSGTVFFDDMYWNALENNLPMLRELAESSEIPIFEERDFVWQI